MKSNRVQVIWRSLRNAATLGVVASVSIHAMADDNAYSFASFELNQPTHHAFELTDKFDFNVAPKLTVGIAKDFQLSNDWLVTNHLGLFTQKSTFHTTDSTSISTRGDLSQFGVIAGSRFKYTGFSQSIMPFVEAQASVSDVSYSFNNIEQKQYQLATGIEFKASNDSSLSISVGYSDGIGNDGFANQ